LGRRDGRDRREHPIRRPGVALPRNTVDCPPERTDRRCRGCPVAEAGCGSSSRSQTWGLDVCAICCCSVRFAQNGSISPPPPDRRGGCMRPQAGVMRRARPPAREQITLPPPHGLVVRPALVTHSAECRIATDQKVGGSTPSRPGSRCAADGVRSRPVPRLLPEPLILCLTPRVHAVDGSCRSPPTPSGAC
jgi:hypothetical protein